MAKGNTKSTAPKPKTRTAKVAEKKQPAGDSNPTSSRSSTPVDLQQKCLNVFRDTFKPDETNQNILQEVKGHLFNRDFAVAFGKEEYLRVYASRWSPSRALGYLQVLTDVQENLFEDEGSKGDGLKKSFRTVCLGGGAGAEIVALAGWMHQILRQGEESQIQAIDTTLVDIAAWDQIITGLQNAVTTAPELSKYASAAAKEANAALVPGDAFRASFKQIDALALSQDDQLRLLGGMDLVTLMFTLNELYSTSMAKTQQMLACITNTVKPGACLLVVDSPGSYSTVSINGAEKKYPMHWLLDYSLIGTEQSRSKAGAAPAKWEKLVSDESRWFRLPQGLNYPIDLENMRYQIHLYKRLAESEPG